MAVLENYAVRNIEMFPEEGMTGRRKITVSTREITEANVVEILNRTLPVHARNAVEIRYLYDVYRGKQDILQKRKEVRENINNKVIVNRANEIVTFKTAYLLNDPVQYVCHSADRNIAASVAVLNEMMRAENKAAKDKEIVDWMHICGVGERLVLPALEEQRGGAPFCIYTLLPDEAYVIYSSDFRKKSLGGVLLGFEEDNEPIAEMYTDSMYFKIKRDKIIKAAPHAMRAVPLVEYLNNKARIGAFEVVLSLLNSINTLESNAVDSVVDFVNGYDVFQDCGIEDGDYRKLSIGGKAVGIKTITPGVQPKVYRIYSELNQAGVQTRIDDQTNAYLEICGMPNRNGGLSTSDTGTAVLFRDGWSAADSRAKDTETLFKEAEREFDRLVLGICDRANVGLNLKISDFEPKFPRGNLANLQSKAQVICEMLATDKLHPKYAFEKCGLFDDPEEAYRVSMEYYEEQRKAEEDALEKELDNARTQALRSG